MYVYLNKYHFILYYVSGQLHKLFYKELMKKQTKKYILNKKYLKKDIKKERKHILVLRKTTDNGKVFISVKHLRDL